MYCKCLPNCFKIWALTSGFKFPVGLVNCLNPLGHSGHFKLHAVVGSIEMAIGLPQ